MTSRTPQELMRLFQEGDESAFRELVCRYKEPIASFAARMLNDSEKGVDIAQETFIRVFTHAAEYRPMAGFTGWLYRIAHNLVINEIRRQKRQPAEAVRLGAAEPGDEDRPRFELRDQNPSAEELLLGRERSDTVRRCVAALPPKYRGAIVMKDMEGLTFEEIAQSLDCPESTVKSRVMRAREMLRRKLEPYLSGCAGELRQATPARQTTGS